jgi:mutator protein MutT
MCSLRQENKSPMTEGTLIYMFRDDQVLLAMKKRGFGQGKWNGPGGKMHPGETPAQAGVRETQEEIGVTPALDEPLGRMQYHDSSAGDWVVHIYRTAQWQGQPTESEEMKPQWFKVTDIPYDTMWSGDEKWMPLVIAGKKFSAEMWFDGQQNNIKADIREL